MFSAIPPYVSGQYSSRGHPVQEHGLGQAPSSDNRTCGRVQPAPRAGGVVSPRKSDSRERMVLRAAELLREYGAATSIDRVPAHSGAPRARITTTSPAGGRS